MPSVLLTTEGTYPCYQGGVSVWCDQLIRKLSEIDFHVLAITDSPGRMPVFSFPENVRTCRLLPLWGTEEPGADESFSSKDYLRKLRTTAGAIHGSFIEPFEITVRALLNPDASPEELAGGMLHLHLYFRNYDYAWTMASPETWDAFLRSCRNSFPHAGHLDLEEATNCMRWLQRYLVVVSLPYPPVDIAHASMAGLAGIAGVLAKLLHGSRFLLSEHGIYLRELYLNLSRTDYSLPCKRFLLSLNEAVARMNYHFADLVTSLCAFNRHWQIRLGTGASKIRLTPNGADPAVFAPRPEGERERPTVLTMARIGPLKGIDVLLRAAALVRERIPEARFQVLGEVADQEYFQTCLELRSKLRLNACVEFGQTHDSPSAYQQADVFCLPSVSEGMPFAVLEAMLSGLPVVATDVGGVAEVVGETGVLVKPNDAQDLARGLLSLLEGGAVGAARRAALSTAALARARANYTAQQSAERFRELYESLLYEDSRLFGSEAGRTVAVAGA